MVARHSSEAYTPFENEKLLGQVLGSDRDSVVVASKFATDFTDDGQPIGLDGSPEHARRAIDRSLRHLGTDHVDLWYLHRADPNVPIEDTVGAMAEAVTAGKARYIGVSETSAETLRRAHATFPITAIQSEYSLFERDAEHNG
ncbi:aldo/keto reductase, partial [Frondihabitans peucedani]|uniref:aldo/keto reductase n=1 Tax=Frondihabitans peucedani TaxID=598626 RepID=UPI0031E06164